MTEGILEVRGAKGAEARSGDVEAEPPFARLLLRLVDVGLAGVLFLAPLFMGGRGDVGQFVYIGVVGFTAVVWAIRQCFLAEGRWRWSGVEWLLAAGVLLVVAQLVPWPQHVLLKVSPEIGNLLPLWTTSSDPGSPLGAWSQWSLAPQATRGGLVLFLTHVLLFLVVVQRANSFRDIERLLRWLALAAMGMATLGLLQFLFGNGKFLWIYEHPFRDTRLPVKGTFQNQNHFAGFLALGLGPLLWWLQQRGAGRSDMPGGFSARAAARGGWLEWAAAIGLALTLLAGLLTFSRGGVVALGTATLVCLGGLAWKRQLGRRAVAGAAALAVLVAAALSIYGFEPLTRRLSSLTDAKSLEELSRGRYELWSAHLEAIPRFPWTGTGVGSHRDVYRTYLSEHFDVEFTHGENGYLHLLLETGFPGLALMVLAAAWAVYWCLRTMRWATHTRHATAAVALLAGLAASLVQSAGDFVWYIPACLSLTVVIAACACRLCHLATSAETLRRGGEAGSGRAASSGLRRHGDGEGNRGGTRLARPAWVCCVVGLVAVSGAFLAEQLPAARSAPLWDEYFRLSRSPRESGGGARATAEAAAAISRHLQDLVRRDPYHARARLRLAGLYLHLFDQRQQSSENPMSLAQIRDAALASQFPNPEAQDRWLAVVLGENRKLLDAAMEHATGALRLCPLLGEGYVYLTELSFLQGPDAGRKRAYIAQALRVRPHSGAVLLAAGSEAALAGDPAQALAYWKDAFRADTEQRIKLIELLAPQMPPEMFLKQFAPDRTALGQLHAFYLQNQLVPQANVVAEPYAATLVAEAKKATGLEAAERWGQAADVFFQLGDRRQAIACAQQAVANAPDEFARHQRLGALLLAAERFDEAVRELQWCTARNPEDAALKNLLMQANRRRLAGTAAALTP